MQKYRINYIFHSRCRYMENKQQNVISYMYFNPKIDLILDYFWISFIILFFVLEWYIYFLYFL